MRPRTHNWSLLTFSTYERIWLFSVVALLIVTITIVPDLIFEDTGNLAIVLCSIVSIISSPICELLISKQSRYWTMFSLFFVEIPDIVILFGMGLYSSAFLSLFFWIPFDIITFATWRGKNIDADHPELTKVKTFKPLQSALVVLTMISLGVFLGAFLPLASEDSNSYIVAFSNVFEIANGIFLLTRHTEQWFAWLGYLICEIIIWISLGHYVMLITVFAMLVNTIYGLVKWLRYTSAHNAEAT